LTSNLKGKKFETPLRVTCLFHTTFASNSVNIFATHYTQKALKARSIANVTFAVESFVGTLPPFEGKRLYMA
jgi:hypothetical protein